MQRTLAIIKPDAVSRNLAGRIISRIETSGFRILAMRLVRLSKAEAEGFYAVHRQQPFFASLTDYMSSGPCIGMVLEKEDAIAAWRKLTGATNPAEAEEDTIRKDFGENIERNSVHGSDGPETAAFEIPYFFSHLDLV
ncbi:MAG: nucleoside-diphosphate kinase [Nitrospinota bacterium]